MSVLYNNAVTILTAGRTNRITDSWGVGGATPSNFFHCFVFCQSSSVVYNIFM